MADSVVDAPPRWLTRWEMIPVWVHAKTIHANLKYLDSLLDKGWEPYSASVLNDDGDCCYFLRFPRRWKILDQR